MLFVPSLSWINILKFTYITFEYIFVFRKFMWKSAPSSQIFFPTINLTKRRCGSVSLFVVSYLSYYESVFYFYFEPAMLHWRRSYSLTYRDGVGWQQLHWGLCEGARRVCWHDIQDLCYSWHVSVSVTTTSQHPWPYVSYGHVFMSLTTAGRVRNPMSDMVMCPLVWPPRVCGTMFDVVSHESVSLTNTGQCTWPYVWYVHQFECPPRRSVSVAMLPSQVYINYNTLVERFSRQQTFPAPYQFGVSCVFV